MATNAKPVYKRILLKLEWRSSAGHSGIGCKHTGSYGSEIKEPVELGIQAGVVIAGVTCSVALFWRKRV